MELTNIDEIVQEAFDLSASAFDRSRSTTPPSKTPSMKRGVLLPTYLLRNQRPRPQVTLSYTQSLDGSVSLGDSKLLPEAGATSDESMQLTHRLRAKHDAVLVGINAVLRQDSAPLAHSDMQSMVEQPQSVIVDTDLSIPLGAKALSHTKKPWIFCRQGLEDSEKTKVEAPCG